jgi:hypothetical protein
MLCNAVAKRLVLLSALVVCGSGPASAKAMSEWKLHGWLVGAYTNDTTKQFSHCAASIKYRSGILLLFSVTKDFRWMMGFANPEWRLNSGSGTRSGMRSMPSRRCRRRRLPLPQIRSSPSFRRKPDCSSSFAKVGL